MAADLVGRALEEDPADDAFDSLAADAAGFQECSQIAGSQHFGLHFALVLVPDVP